MRLAIVTIALAATAATSALPSVARERKPRDPNETVCEDQGVLGSRLASRRVCLTRAQWAEKQRDERALVDRSQTQLCVADGGKCSRGQ